MVGRNFMLQLPVGAEHRWGERVRVDLPVQVLEEEHRAVSGYLRNLSLSGALLRSNHDWRLYAAIGIRIVLPSSLADSCVVKARVARKPGNGIGIEWCDFAPAIVKDLLRLPSGAYPL